MALSTRLVPTASRLINKYGTSMILTTFTDGVYDPTTSQIVRSSTSQTVNGLIEEYADSIRFLGNKVETGGNLIQEGDKKVTIAAQDLNQTAPDVNKGTLTVRGIVYNIIGVAAQQVDSLVAYFVFHLRKT